MKAYKRKPFSKMLEWSLFKSTSYDHGAYKDNMK